MKVSSHSGSFSPGLSAASARASCSTANWPSILFSGRLSAMAFCTSASAMARAVIAGETPATVKLLLGMLPVPPAMICSPL
ncbi:MAG: hypothetical protein ACK5XO_15265 [Phycisphaerales bacterium]